MKCDGERVKEQRKFLDAIEELNAEYSREF